MLYSFVYMDLVGFVFFICVFISSWVFLMLFWQFLWNYDCCLLDGEDNLVEFFWTVFPSSIVLFMCFLNLHCIGGDMYRGVLEITKVVGRQWFWEYELGDGGAYESYMADFINSVDKPLRLSVNKSHCLLITSGDVIHSFSVPAFNVKMDAIPGRINYLLLHPMRLGVFVGYCSELCGAGHAYMPVVLEVVKPQLKYKR